MRIIETLLARIPLVYVVMAPIAATSAFAFSLWTNSQIESTYDIIFRFALYSPFALAVSVVFMGKVILCKRSGDPDGLVSLWLTTVTYAWGCFAVTMWGVVLLIAVNAFGISLFEWSNGLILRGLSYGFVGIGMMGEVIAAAVFIVGARRDGLGTLIHPLPFKRRSQGPGQGPGRG